MTEPMTPAALNMALAERLKVDLTRTLSRAEFVEIVSEFIGFPWDGERWLPAIYVDGPEGGIGLPEARNDINCEGSFDWVAGWIYDNRDVLSKEVCAFVDHLTVGLKRDPPNYAGDLATAYSLGEEMRKRGLFEYRQFASELEDVLLGKTEGVMDDVDILAAIAHASAYDRAIAAYRALGGTE